MSQKQLNKYTVIDKVIDGQLTIVEAAAALGITTRQVIRLKKGVIAEGAQFLIHKNSNRKPSNSLDQSLVNRIITLKQSDLYSGANFAHFRELLARHEDISISYSALHGLLTKSNIKSPKKRRRFKPHRRRKRKLQTGLLIQMDATPFEWFGTPEKFALHGAIDDATGKIVGLFLTKNECLHGYWEVSRQIVLNHGVPVSLYTDRHAIFLSSNASKISLEDQFAGRIINDTQFGRAMAELGVVLIPARSPQAKGRVERLWETLQSRLPVEFKIAGITSIDAANEFLASYIALFNATFAVAPEDPEVAFSPLSPSKNIDTILCVKSSRVVDAGGVFSFYNRHYKVTTSPGKPLLPPKSKVSVLVSPYIGIKILYKNVLFDVLPYIKTKTTPSPVPGASPSKHPYIPPEGHYYKQGQSLVKKVTFEDSDRDIISMLESIFLKKYA
jgi:transposase